MVSTSPLLELAAELRNAIWRYSLIANDGIDITTAETPNEPGLLAVCTQIRSEALEMHYVRNCFKLQSTSTYLTEYHSLLKHFSFDRSFLWLRSIGAQRARMITQLHLVHQPELFDESRPNGRKAVVFFDRGYIEMEINLMIQSLLWTRVRIETLSSRKEPMINPLEPRVAGFWDAYNDSWERALREFRSIMLRNGYKMRRSRR